LLKIADPELDWEVERRGRMLTGGAKGEQIAV
jgi:hypothetical protein